MVWVDIFEGATVFGLLLTEFESSTIVTRLFEVPRLGDLEPAAIFFREGALGFDVPEVSDLRCLDFDLLSSSMILAIDFTIGFLMKGFELFDFVVVLETLGFLDG